MAETTKIQWTSHTFNPWRGCTKVNAGCANCYAEVNYSVKMHNIKWGPNGTRAKTSESYWRQPLKWNREAECDCGAAGRGDRECLFCANGCHRPRVFCASLADVFEDWDGPIVDHKGRQLFFQGTAFDGKSIYGTDQISETGRGAMRAVFTPQ